MSTLSSDYADYEFASAGSLPATVRTLPRVTLPPATSRRAFPFSAREVADGLREWDEVFVGTVL